MATTARLVKVAFEVGDRLEYELAFEIYEDGQLKVHPNDVPVYRYRRRQISEAEYSRLALFVEELRFDQDWLDLAPKLGGRPGWVLYRK